jgi:hypothetical protein
VITFGIRVKLYKKASFGLYALYKILNGVYIPNSVSTPNNAIKLRRPFFDISIGAATVFGVLIILLLFVVYPNFIPISLLVGIVVYLGLGLPRWQGKEERARRAKEAKEKELAKWGFYSRDREGPWLNYVDYPLIKKSKYAKDRQFYSEWLIIYNGSIIVNPGYSVISDDESSVEYDFYVKRAYA